MTQLKVAPLVFLAYKHWKNRFIIATNLRNIFNFNDFKSVVTRIILILNANFATNIECNMIYPDNFEKKLALTK